MTKPNPAIEVEESLPSEYREKVFLMISKFNSTCKLCGNSIKTGIDKIGKIDDQWCCENCATGEPAPIVDKAPIDLSDALGVSSGFTKSDANLVAIKTASIGELPENYTPSQFQLDIFDFVENESGNAVIEAVAGSGKTTTIIEALKLTPKDSRVAFVAFNKHIARELELRAPAHVHVSTLHSLGFSNLRRNGSAQVDNDKLSNILRQIWPTSRKACPKNSVRAVNRIKVTATKDLIGLVKATLIDHTDVEAIKKLVIHYTIDLNSFEEEIISKVELIIERCIETDYIIDFNDMLWLPIVLDLPLQKFDLIFIDEAQDLNANQAEFVKRSIAEDGRVIAVGDRRQSLYGFAGADTDSIPNLIKSLNAKVLPLSITYRCPTSHVELAQKIEPLITAREGAEEGLVADITMNNLINKLEPGDMVICRTNAPLVKPAFELIRKGVKAVVRGRDIGANLVNLIRRFKTQDIYQLDIKLGEYLQRETAYLLQRKREMAVVSLQDRVATIRVIMSDCDNTEHLIAKIENLFSDENKGIVLSSVHKAKGLEADRVFILEPDLLPHPRAEPGWQMVQEMNCKYVALTRAKKELYFVKG